MALHEQAVGKSNEWYTPQYVFAALGEHFTLDVAAPSLRVKTFVPADYFITANSLASPWHGFIWMNPPFGGRNGIRPWLDKFFEHGNGIALAPDRTSCPWWQEAVRKADATLAVAGKIRFIRPDGTAGKSPAQGTTLFGIGDRACNALMRAEFNGLGIVQHRPLSNS